MKMTTLTAALIASFFIGGAATAQDAGGPMASVRQACASDMQTYCGKTQPRTQERRQCMQDNRSKFSKPCQDALQQMQQRWGGHRDQTQGGQSQGGQN